jgi:CheY-like chemotaxis protein
LERRVIPSVLIVDGDPDTRLLYRTALEAVMDSVVEAEDGAEALGIALCRQPSVVITETRLKRVDGFELCSMLRASPALRSAGIVVVTADARPAEAARAADAGADEVLTKPCHVEAIVEAALRTWQRRQSSATRAPADGEAKHRLATKVRQRERYVTSHPPSQPPQLRCPICDRMLQYDRSHVGGVSDVHPEQWDYYVCAGRCGTFQYRQRTRTVRRVAQLADGEWMDSDVQARRA